MQNTVGRDSRGLNKSLFKVAWFQATVDEDHRFDGRLPVEDGCEKIVEALQFPRPGANVHQQDESVHPKWQVTDGGHRERHGGKKPIRRV